jgi:hypothetical protein
LRGSISQVKPVSDEFSTLVIPAYCDKILLLSGRVLFDHRAGDIVKADALLIAEIERTHLLT